MLYFILYSVYVIYIYIIYIYNINYCIQILLYILYIYIVYHTKAQSRLKQKKCILLCVKVSLAFFLKSKKCSFLSHKNYFCIFSVKIFFAFLHLMFAIVNNFKKEMIES